MVTHQSKPLNRKFPYHSMIFIHWLGRGCLSEVEMILRIQVQMVSHPIFKLRVVGQGAL